MILWVWGLMPDANPPVGSLRGPCSVGGGQFSGQCVGDVLWSWALGIQCWGCFCTSPAHRGAAAPGPAIPSLFLHPFSTALTSANPPLALCQARVFWNNCSSLLPVKNQLYQCWRTWIIFKTPSDCLDPTTLMSSGLLQASVRQMKAKPVPCSISKCLLQLCQKGNGFVRINGKMLSWRDVTAAMSVRYLCSGHGHSLHGETTTAHSFGSVCRAVGAAGNLTASFIK